MALFAAHFFVVALAKDEQRIFANHDVVDRFRFSPVERQLDGELPAAFDGGFLKNLELFEFFAFAPDRIDRFDRGRNAQDSPGLFLTSTPGLQCLVQRLAGRGLLGNEAFRRGVSTTAGNDEQAAQRQHISKDGANLRSNRTGMHEELTLQLGKRA